MPSIRGSVGARGRNALRDVKVVQALLNDWRRDIALDRPLAVDGLMGRKTLTAIVEFQGRVVGMVEPDGRVDPGGLTLRTLNARDKIFTLLPKAGRGYYTYGKSEKRYGTTATLRSVERAARSAEASGLLVGVGNISLRKGGRMRPHTSHQRGVNVDFRPVRVDRRRRPVRIDDRAYSRSSTAKLVRALRSDPNLDLILFNDEEIPGVRSWPGHDNHLHVRFKK